MKTWYRILGGLLVLDLSAFLLAWPLFILIEGSHSELFWAVHAMRIACGIICGVLLVALLVVWNLEYNLPKK